MAETKKTATPTLSAADKAAAAKASAAQKAEKANKEKERRTIVRVLEKAKLDMKPGDLDAEQRERAVQVPEKKAGLSGTALAGWVLEGKNTAAQAQEGKAAAKAAGKVETNVTRSKDPEAADLAAKAKALAPDVKSAFLPKDARAFLDEILKGQKAVDLLSREIPAEGEEPARTITVTQAALKKFAVENEKTSDEAKLVRAHLTALGSGTRLWGRKLGLMILAQVAAEKK